MTARFRFKYFIANIFSLMLGTALIGTFILKSIDRPDGGVVAPEHVGNKREYASLNEAITAALNKVESVDEKYMAQNKANEMVAVFSAKGTELRTEASKTPINVTWKLGAIGYGENSFPVSGDAKMEAENDRFSYKHQTETGIVEEWFNNKPDGIEHGFVVAEKQAESNGELLRLTLKVAGDLTAKADVDGQSLDLNDAGGNLILKYHDLKVWDASKKTLPAWMRTEIDGEVWIEVDDHNATYPITIDPVFLQCQKIAPIDSANGDSFGRSIAISGNTAVVGAPSANVNSNTRQGAAYVFVRDGANWIQQAKLVGSNGSSGNLFGWSVDIEGDTIVVGAKDFSSANTNGNVGAVYVFARSGGTWSPSQTPIVVTENGGAFGAAVSISGDTILVSQPGGDDKAGNDQGVVAVLTRAGSTFFVDQVLIPSDAAAGDHFGSSLQVVGNTAFIGAPDDDIGENGDQGSVYVFTLSGDNWVQQTKLTASDGSANDGFGGSVALVNTLSGPIAVIGARFDTVAGDDDRGSAYVFKRQQIGGWSQTQKLIATGESEFAFFGISVAIASITGDTIVIGAPGNGTSVHSQGAAHVFKNIGGTFTQQQKLTSADDTSLNFFGLSVAISGNTILTSAPASISRSGAIYSFNLGSRPSDFDGDGKSDVSVFRPSTGAWYLNRSTAGVLGTTWGISSDRIVPADYDGDGKTDIAVFRPSEGRWYILNSATGTFSSSLWGGAADVPAPADYDGDGKADVSIFRPSDGNWWLNRTTLGTTTIPYGQNGDIPAVGDYDGDSKADVAIFRPSNGVWSIHRSSGGDTGYQFGFGTDKLAQADYDGDGKTDIAIYRPSTGQWFIANSGSATFPVIAFGAATDIPTPGDYDGDGRADTAIFRPSDGNWWLNRSTAGVTVMQFGQNGDKPLPNAYGN